MAKLVFRVVGKHEGSAAFHDSWDVEWTHPDGFQQSEVRPVTHPPNIKYETFLTEKTASLVDQVNVPTGTPDEIALQIIAKTCQAKIPRICEQFKLDP